MASTSPDRQRDEEVLAMLAERRAGRKSREIGADFGLASNAVRVLTDRVRRADAAESGEETEYAYW